MSVRIGCDHLVYARQTTEETATTPAVYETPKRAIGVIAVNINPNPSQDTLFADDGPFETATTLGQIEVEINKANLTPTELSELLGHERTAGGEVVYRSTDIPPWTAIGFRTLKSSGAYRYVWLLKGKFMTPEDNNDTKGDSINWQTDTINGQFVMLHNSKIWKRELDADDPAASPTLIANWFNAVPATMT
jgi:phi13 family phage major tail protein